MPDPSPTPGTSIAGKYRLKARLGMGGMGTVWRAEHQNLGKDVALKLINPRLGDDPDARRRFLREVETATSFVHKYAVQVRDFGEDDGRLYLSMDLIEGSTLKQLLELGRFGSKRVITLGCQVLEALEEAHAAGIVHRDLKPANLIVTEGREGEEIRILDFGIARALSGGADTTVLTAEGSAVGTLAYMSPEQAQGKKLDGRTDLYSLAVVLYELLSGVRPIDPETDAEDPRQSLMFRIPTVPPRDLADVAPHVGAGLRRVIHKALAKLPGDRHADAQAFRRVLRAVRLDETDLLETRAPPTAPRPVGETDSYEPTTPLPPARPEQTRPASKPWGLLAGLVLLVVAGLIAGLVIPWELEPTQSSTEAPPAPTEDQAQLALKANALSEQVDALLSRFPAPELATEEELMKEVQRSCDITEVEIVTYDVADREAHSALIQRVAVQVVVKGKRGAVLQFLFTLELRETYLQVIELSLKPVPGDEGLLSLELLLSTCSARAPEPSAKNVEELDQLAGLLKGISESRLRWAPRIARLVEVARSYPDLWFESLSVEAGSSRGLRVACRVKGSDLERVARFRESLKDYGALYRYFGELECTNVEVALLTSGSDEERIDFELFFRDPKSTTDPPPTYLAPEAVEAIATAFTPKIRAKRSSPKTVEGKIDRLFDELERAAQAKDAKTFVDKLLEVQMAVRGPQVAEVDESQREAWNERLEGYRAALHSLQLQIYTNEAMMHLRSMTAAIKAGRYDEALAGYARMEQLKAQMYEEEREEFHRNADALLLRASELADKAKGLKRISEMRLRVVSIIWNPPEAILKSSTVINDRTYSEGDAILDDRGAKIPKLVLKAIRKEEIVFSYDGIEFTRKLLTKTR